MQYTCKPQGVCSKEIRFTVEDGVVRGLHVRGGCDGNLQGIARLVEGMPAEEVIARLEGLRCGEKLSSCPDQLARALRELGSSQGCC